MPACPEPQAAPHTQVHCAKARASLAVTAQKRHAARHHDRHRHGRARFFFLASSRVCVRLPDRIISRPLDDTSPRNRTRIGHKRGRRGTSAATADTALRGGRRISDGGAAERGLASTPARRRATLGSGVCCGAGQLRPLRCAGDWRRVRRARRCGERHDSKAHAPMLRRCTVDGTHGLQARGQARARRRRHMSQLRRGCGF
jgi:hypothetical protein